MATNESSFRKEFCEDWREQLPGGRIYSLNDKFIRGWPDLFGDSPYTGPTFIETKWAVRPKKPDTPLTLGLTAHQRKWLRDSWRNGTTSIWLLGVKDKRIEYAYLGFDWEVEYVQQTCPHLMREHGQHWDIMQFFRQVDRERKRLLDRITAAAKT